MSISGGICVVAGEASGDAQIAPVLKFLQSELAQVGARDVHLWGAAGPYMREMGVEPLVRTEDLAVMAFSEIVPAYFRVRQAYGLLLSEIEKRRPVAVILVDYPGFNLKLARDAFLRGNTVLYHVAPKVWAHGWNRVHSLSKYTHLVTSILPFEEKMLREAGVNAYFVGNPLADGVQNELRARVLAQETSREKIEIALLPGSRKSELKALAPVFIKSLWELEKRLQKPLLGRLPVAQTLSADYVRKVFENACATVNVSHDWLKSRVSFEECATYSILRDARYAWVCSGTAALEVGLFGVPNAVVYRTSLFSALILKAIMRVPYVSLGNLCARRQIVPEFLQYQATPENLASHAYKLLTDENARSAMRTDLEGLRRLFPVGGAQLSAQKMVHVILQNLLTDREKYRNHVDAYANLLNGREPYNG